MADEKHPVETLIEAARDAWAELASIGVPHRVDAAIAPAEAWLTRERSVAIDVLKEAKANGVSATIDGEAKAVVTFAEIDRQIERLQ